MAVAAWKDSDIETALERLRPEMLAYAKKYLPELDAEDAVQVGSMWCWNKRSDFRGNYRDFRQWFYKVMQLVVRDARRRVNILQKIEVIKTSNSSNDNHSDYANGAIDAMATDDPTITIIEQMSAESEQAHLQQLIASAKLSAKQMTILSHRMSGWSNREIATALGTNSSNIKSHYVEIIIKLRSAIKAVEVPAEVLA